jgi:hypothetical protein
VIKTLNSSFLKGLHVARIKLHIKMGFFVFMQYCN